MTNPSFQCEAKCLGNSLDEVVAAGSMMRRDTSTFAVEAASVSPPAPA